MRRREFLRGGARAAAAAAAAVSGGIWDLTDSSRAQAAARQNQQPAKRLILVWSEGTAPKEVYPRDVNSAVAEGLASLRGYEVMAASITDPEQGLSQAALEQAAVLVWWGHIKHGDIPDATVERIVKRIRAGGMGFVALHSAHYAKPLKAILNATGDWKGGVANDGKPHRIIVADKQHPIARGVRDFTIPQEERYEEPFDVPKPDGVVLDGVHEANGSRTRQGILWNVGKGRVFYFRPGHETYPVFFQPEVRRVLRNAVLWAAGDEAGIWEDNDPAARAARAAGEPPLALIVRDAGYGATDVTKEGEINAPMFVRAGPGNVTFRPLAAYGVLETCAAGWYRPQANVDSIPAKQRTTLWKIDAPNNKRMNPPLMRGAKTAFDPGARPFGLWVATEGFPGEVVYTEDALQMAIPRFRNGTQKAHVYHAVKSDGTPVPNALIIGFEYSTNDDNQEIVALIENVRPFHYPST